MNVGPSDIIKGIEILKWIWQNGFVRENSKDRRYELFRRDVQDFDAVLQDLDKALEGAEERYRQRGLASAINPRDLAFEQERCRLVGAFEQTLRECQTILAKHLITPRTNAQGKLQSLIWAATVEDKVNELRRRLQLHTQKMLLVVNRLSLRLMTDSADTLDDVLALSEQSVLYHERTHAMMRDLFNRFDALTQGRLPSTVILPSAEITIPEELAQRFQTSLSVNAPLVFVHARYDLRELPMDETFDVLVYYSTDNADAAAGLQMPERYVQLLKALWLVRQLKTSQGYLNARPGYYYRRAIIQIEQKLLVRLRDPRLVSVDGELLIALSNEVYEIWPSPEPVFTISQLDAGPDEREEVQLDLILQGDFTQQRIVIFRRSEDRFRIVQENIRNTDLRVDREIVSLFFDMTHDFFIPWYSLPQADQSVHEVAMSNRTKGDIESYRFRSSTDLYRFQEVILGQRMVYEDPKVDFKLSDGYRGRGRIQIWQEPVASSPPSGEQCHSTFSSDVSFSPSSPRSPGMGSTTGSFAPSTIFEHAEGTEGGYVPIASLVILTELKGRVTYIYIGLEQGLRIFHEHCKCGTGLVGYQSCHVLSLAKEGRRKFPIRVKQADVDAHGQTIVQSCDISVFRLPLNPLPSRSRLRKVDHLSMTFETPNAKDAFNLELRNRFQLRDAMLRQHNNHDFAMRYTAERPEKIRTSHNPVQRYLGRTTSITPSIGSLQMGPSFADDVAEIIGVESSGSRSGQSTTNSSSHLLTHTSTDLPTRLTEQPAQRLPVVRPAVVRSEETGTSGRHSATSSSFRRSFLL